MLFSDQEVLLPGFSQSEVSNFSPNSWIQAALSDPCMFHAVLLAASSHLDVLRNECDNLITHFHKRNTIRLLRNNISGGGTLQHTSITAAMYLWHHEVSKSLIPILLMYLNYDQLTDCVKVMNGHWEVAEIHKNGLRQMVKESGGLARLGFDGFLAHLITL